jgi:hypothetical protein
LRKLFSNQVKTLLLLVVLTLSSNCRQIVIQGEAPYLNLPKDYVSQKKIVLQGYSLVPTSYGHKPSVFFGYDRDSQTKTHHDNSNKSKIDLIEFKLLNETGAWSWYPLVIVTDDDFDGCEDRLFVDADFNNVIDKVYDVKKNKIEMEEIKFDEISPWRLKNNGSKTDFF